MLDASHLTAKAVHQQHPAGNSPAQPDQVQFRNAMQAVRRSLPAGASVRQVAERSIAAIPAAPFPPADPRARTLVSALLELVPSDSISDWSAVGILGSALGRWAGTACEGWEAHLRRGCRRLEVEAFEREFDVGSDHCHHQDLVAGLLTACQSSTFGGPEKSCKTILAADLVAAAKTGTPFLGHQIPQAFKVAVLAFEGRADHFRKLVCLSLIRRGLTADDASDLAWNGFLVSADRGLLLNRDKRQKFENYLGTADVKLTIVDCLYQATSKATGTSLFMEGREYRSLVKPIVSAGAAPLLIHHTREIPSGSPPKLNDLAGAGLSAFVKSWLLVNRADAYDGSGVHRLVATSGTSEGAFASLAIEIREADMRVSVATQTADTRSAATNKSKQPRPAFLTARR